MLRMLVVDDEPEIADSLYELFLDANYSDMEVLRKSSSREAFELINSLKIDLLVTDIRMPELNGFQLAESAKNNWPKCKVIFLTGYNDFEYAYNAIRNNCDDYLLKTESDDTILHVVGKTVQKVIDDLQDEVLMDKVKRQLKNALPIMQREFILNLLNGAIKPVDITKKQLDELEIPIRLDSKLFFFIGRIDELPPKSMDTLSNHEIMAAIRVTSEESFSRYSRKIYVEYDHEVFIYIVQPEDGNKENAVDDILIIKGAVETIQNICRESLDITVSIALCSHMIDANHMVEEFIKLKKILDFSWGIGREAFLTDNSFFTGEFERISRYENDIGENELSNLRCLNVVMNCLERGMQDEYFEGLSPIVDCLKRVKSMNNNLALEIYYSVAGRLLSYINRWKLEETIAFKIGIYKLTKIESHGSWEEATEYLYAVSREIFDARKNNQENAAASSIQYIQKYINENLDQDLSLNKLADLLHFNPSYLSRLFKQVAGVNLSDYIMNLRLEKAKELLAESGLKIHELTKAIGLDSSTYFARIFKKSTNMSPLQYRDLVCKK